MSERLDGNTLLCKEYLDDEGPLIECDLPLYHEGDHHAVVTWPKRTPMPLRAEPTPMSEALVRAWAPEIERQLRAVAMFKELGRE